MQLVRPAASFGHVALDAKSSLVTKTQHFGVVRGSVGKATRCRGDQSTLTWADSKIGSIGLVTNARIAVDVRETDGRPRNLIEQENLARITPRHTAVGYIQVI